MQSSFLKLASELRKKHKIPSAGFKVKTSQKGAEEFIAYTKIGTPAYMEILADWRLFLRDHGKSQLLANVATEYTIKGEGYLDGLMPDEITHRYCFIQHHYDFVEIKVYPGAIRHDIEKALDSEWPGHEKDFRRSYPDEYKKRPKTKRNKGRDLELHHLRQIGVLNADGSFNTSKARDYLDLKYAEINKTKIDTSKIDDFPAAFGEVGIDLPKAIGARRSALERVKELLQG